MHTYRALSLKYYKWKAPLDFILIYVRTIASIGTLLRLSFSNDQFLAATGRDYKWRFKGRIPHLPRAYGWVV